MTNDKEPREKCCGVDKLIIEESLCAKHMKEIEDSGIEIEVRDHTPQQECGSNIIHDLATEKEPCADCGYFAPQQTTLRERVEEILLDGHEIPEVQYKATGDCVMCGGVVQIKERHKKYVDAILELIEGESLKIEDKPLISTATIRHAERQRIADAVEGLRKDKKYEDPLGKYGAGQRTYGHNRALDEVLNIIKDA